MANVANTQQTPPAQGGNKIDSSFVQSKMQIPANLQAPYQKIILAGRKIMYAPQMTPQIAALLKGSGTPGQKMGQGVVALMAALISQSNHTMPPQLIIPAASELIVEFADMLRQSGLQVTDDDIAEGMATMVSSIMQRAGISPQKLQAMLSSKQAAAAGQPPTTPAPQPAGLVGGAMSAAPQPAAAPTGA